MKKMMFSALFAVAILTCFGQRYEVLIDARQRDYPLRGTFLGYFNDSTITIYTVGGWFKPSNDYTLQWDLVDRMRIRNVSRMNTGALAGAAIGSVITYFLMFREDAGYGVLFLPVIIPPAGALLGAAVFSQKITIPLEGKKAREKSAALRDFLNN